MRHTYCPFMEMPINLINHTELLVLKIPSTCWVMPWHFSMQRTCCELIEMPFRPSILRSVEHWQLWRVSNWPYFRTDENFSSVTTIWLAGPVKFTGLVGRSSQGESRDLFHNCLSHTYERTDISAAIMKNCFRSYQNKSPCSSSEIGVYELGVDH